MKKPLSVLVFFAFLPMPSIAGWFSPDNYEECILDKLPDVEGKLAAIQINRACGVKYKNKYIHFSGVSTEAELKEWFDVPRFSPEKAADCKLSHITKTTGKRAVIMISIACQNLYPTRLLTEDEKKTVLKKFKEDKERIKKAKTFLDRYDPAIKKDKLEQERIKKAKIEKAKSKPYKKVAPVPYEPIYVAPSYRPTQRKSYTRIGDPSLYDYSKRNPNKNSNPKCNLKPVMTTEDYRNCGITPPQ